MSELEFLDVTSKVSLANIAGRMDEWLVAVAEEDNVEFKLDRDGTAAHPVPLRLATDDLFLVEIYERRKDVSARESAQRDRFLQEKRKR